MMHISFYVPVDYAEKVKEAMFKSGGGRVGNYDSCSFESRGVGQFRPLKGSQAFVGEVGKVEKIDELRVEMVCADVLLDQVLAAMKANHPYEAPAYYVIKTVG